MINMCGNCNRLLEEGDQVTTRIVSTYHVLKSKIAYALDHRDMNAIEPLKHYNCNQPKGGPEGD